jgi:hypothetical protein
MPKSRSMSRQHSKSRKLAFSLAGGKKRRFSLAGGSGAADYVTKIAGDSSAQYQNVYMDAAHMNSPTGGGMWLPGAGANQNVAFQATGPIPLMSGGTVPPPPSSLQAGGRRHRRTSKRSRRHRRHHKKTEKSWFSKLF